MSLTNVSFPPESTPALHEAVEHYGFESVAAYFRLCGHTLIKHHQRGDSLKLPPAFVSICKQQPKK